MRDLSKAEQATDAAGQSDLEATKPQVNVSDTEFDEDGSPFVLSSNGSTVFGEIREETNLTPAPIKLSLGNSKYGRVHIEKRHGEQIRNAGFNSVEEFVEFVATNYKRIRVGENSVGEPNGTYLLQIEDYHNNTLYIELSTDNSYWSVNSGGVFRKGYGNNKEEVWSASEKQNEQSATDNTLRATDNSDSPVTPNGNVSNSSDSKGINKSATDQTKPQEIVENETPTSIQRAEQETNIEPSEAQKVAGNYKKGHLKLDGYDISIENPKGSIRRGTDADGKEWEQEMQNTYGYIRGTEGVDGDHIDVFLSDDPTKGDVFVVDQVNKDGSFDEHKVMYGFPDIESARKAYLSNYEDGWYGLGAITHVSKEEFKKWIDSSRRKTKPFSEYSSVNKLRFQNSTEAEKTEAVTPKTETASERVETKPETAEAIAQEPKADGKKQNDIDRLIDTAQGDENKKSTQAARKELAKRGIDWKAERQQTDNTLKNNTDAKQLATKAIMESIHHAGIPVEMATDNQTEAVLGNMDAEMQVVFHGSGADFKHFDHSHMGEGEGNQSYGWGSYVTEVEGIGRTYAKSSAEKNSQSREIQRRIGNYMQKIREEKKNLRRVENVYAFTKEYDKHTRHLKRELKRAQKEGDESNIKFYQYLLDSRTDAETERQERVAVIKERIHEYETELNRLKHQLKEAKRSELNSRHLYVVEIPDDKGKNYLRWEGDISYLFSEEFALKIYTDLTRGYDGGGLQETDRLYRVLANLPVHKRYYSGKEFYWDLYDFFTRELGKDGSKEASEYLGSLGYTGISYPAQYRSGGRQDAARNYVIFNEKDLKIVDHVRFMKTPKGNVYGWTVGGKIYLTEAGLNPNTPIHEYTHLWANAIMRQNADGWKGIKGLLKGTPVWEQVMKDENYADIKDNEDAVASEVLSRISGQENAKKMEAEAQRIIDEEPDAVNKAKVVTLIDRMRRALDKFWNWVGKHLFGIREFDSINEVTDRVLYDLVEGTNLKVEENVSEISVRDKEYMDAVERGDMETAQRLVNEAAERAGYNLSSDYQGTSAYNGSAPYGNGYFESKEKRMEAWSNNEFEGESTLGDYIDNGVDPGNIELLTNDASYRHSDGLRKEAIDNISEVIKEKRKTIRMYRSVPSSVKEGSFRNGDWITPSKKYAEKNAEIHGWGNDFRIIEQDVPVDDVWFDGNDIAEWGYGREKDFINDTDFAYRNTLNNRKNLNPVSYDDKGQVIPLSKRFDISNSDPRFQITSSKNEEQLGKERANSDGSYMKAPNGKPSNLNEKQWVQVRTKDFKDWFGDWEKTARIEKLKQSKPVEITGEEIDPSNDLKQYKKNALEYGKKLRGKYTNEDTGEQISLTGGNKRGGLREILQHDYNNVTHLQSIAAIPQIIKKSIFIDELPNEDKSKYTGVKSFRYFVCGLKIADKDYTVKAVVAVQPNGERYYDHKLSKIEKGKLLSMIPTIQKAGIENNLPSSVNKDKRLVSILQVNSSKFVDENGEPKVFYHNTNNNFTVFDPSKNGTHTDAGWLGDGFYFYGDESEGNGYGHNKMAVFLNVRDPYYATSVENNELAEANSRERSLEFREEIESEGYDGVYYNGDLRQEAVVFHPNQIKSATENNGEFSKDDDDIRYRAGEDSMDVVNKRFNDMLSTMTEKNADTKIFNLGSPSSILLSAGVEDKPMKLYGNKIFKKMKKHGFALAELQDLPKAVANPIAVFNNYQRKGNRTILTELRSQGKNIMVAITLGKNGVDVDFNIVSSVFGKRGSNIVSWINKGYLTYIDKEKALNYLYFSERGISEATDNVGQENSNNLHISAPIAEAAENSELSSAANIVKYFENLKYSAKRNSNSHNKTENLEGHTAEEMSEKVVQMGNKLHTNIVVYQNVDEITHPNADIQAKRRRSKGWYDKSTGEVHVVIPNHCDVEDVTATVMHETVAHKGLRELIGEKGYEEFLDETYRNLEKGLKKVVDQEAGRAFLNDLTGNGGSYAEHRRRAVDELFGRMAEKPFEEFSKGERTLWMKVRDMVRRFLNRVMDTLHLPRWFKIGDNEIRYMLWRSKERMERGKESPLDVARDIVKRSELGLSEGTAHRIGDAQDTFRLRQRRAVENMGTVMPGLNNAEVNVVNVPRHPFTGTGKQAIEKAKEWAIKFLLGTHIAHQKDNVFYFELNKDVIGKFLSASSTLNSENLGVHLAVLRKLLEVIDESIEVEEHPDYKKKNGVRELKNGIGDENMLIHVMYGAVEIEDTYYIVKTTMYEHNGKVNVPYNYMVKNVELLISGSSTSDALSNSTDSSVKTELSGAKIEKKSDIQKISVKNLVKNIEKSYDKGKFLLDESKKADKNTDLYRNLGETDNI